eukprot:1145816-Pelagomonas_calceolata.AAC.5
MIETERSCMSCTHSLHCLQVQLEPHSLALLTKRECGHKGRFKRLKVQGNGHNLSKDKEMGTVSQRTRKWIQCLKGQGSGHTVLKGQGNGHGWSQLPWYGKMAGKLLLLPQPEFTPYLNVLPDVSLPATWSRDDLEQLQCDYMIEKCTHSAAFAAEDCSDKGPLGKMCVCKLANKDESGLCLDDWGQACQPRGYRLQKRKASSQNNWLPATAASLSANTTVGSRTDGWTDDGYLRVVWCWISAEAFAG